MSAMRTLAMLPGPRRWPVVGNLLSLKPDRLHLTLEEWARVHGDLYVVHLWSRPVLVVGDAALMQQALRDRPGGYRRLTAMREVINEVRATGVFSAEGEQWSRQRRLVMPAFGASPLRAGHAVLSEVTHRLQRRWQRACERGEPVDALADLTRYTVDVTSMFGFGADMNTLEQGTSELRHHLEVILKTISRRIASPFPLWRYVKLPADRAVERSLVEVERVVLQLIRTARAELDADPARAAAPRNLLEAMLSASEGDEPRLSDREVFGNVLTLLAAGEDTTANTMAWMLYFLATHRAEQERVQAEVEEQLGPAALPANPEAVHKLRYLGAVTAETLRLKSVAPVIFVEPVTDVTLGDIQVPADTPILMLSRFAGLRDDSFTDAARFQPSRFLGAPAAGHKHDPRAALSFGAGPRVCPGRGLALLECGMVGAMVAQNFEVELWDPGAPVSEQITMTMRPRGLRIRLQPRRRAQAAVALGA